jgi:site-specific recombinase XerD
MFNLLLKIEEYNRVINLADSTKIKYVKALNSFSIFLSQKLKCGVEDIDLKRVGIIRSKSGDIYTPIRPSLIDEFLFGNSDKNYHELVTLSSALKSFFRYLFKSGNFPDVISNLKFDMKNFNHKKKPTRMLSRHEVIRFFHSMVSHSENLFNEVVLFSLLFSTGMRISELLNLKITDIDFEREMLILEKTKTRKARVVVLRTGFSDILRYYCSINDLSKSDYLFSINGKKISSNRVRSILKVYLKKGNLPDVKIHSVRHSFATHMLDAGSSVFIVQQLLGHDLMSSTRIYIDPNYTRNKNINIKEHQTVYKSLEKPINAVLK